MERLNSNALSDVLSAFSRKEITFKDNKKPVYEKEFENEYFSEMDDTGYQEHLWSCGLISQLIESTFFVAGIRFEMSVEIKEDEIEGFAQIRLPIFDDVIELVKNENDLIVNLFLAHIEVEHPNFTFNTSEIINEFLNS